MVACNDVSVSRSLSNVPACPQTPLGKPTPVNETIQKVSAPSPSCPNHLSPPSLSLSERSSTLPGMTACALCCVRVCVWTAIMCSVGGWYTCRFLPDTVHHPLLDGLIDACRCVYVCVYVCVRWGLDCAVLARASITPCVQGWRPLCASRRATAPTRLPRAAGGMHGTHKQSRVDMVAGLQGCRVPTVVLNAPGSKHAPACPQACASRANMVATVVAVVCAAAPNLIQKAEPLYLDALLPVLCGVLMCFFGGSYLTLIAAVEAYRMTGQTHTCFSPGLCTAVMSTRSTPRMAAVRAAIHSTPQPRTPPRQCSTPQPRTPPRQCVLLVSVLTWARCSRVYR